MLVEQNISRLNHLLKLYNISADELVLYISEGLKTPLTNRDILSSEIKVNTLKRIDKFFKKGLNYYLDPKAPIETNESSIFFRKNKFNADLNIGAKKIVNQFEELKISLSAISKLSDIKIERELPIYSINQNPKVVALELREKLYPVFDNDLREFLKNSISKLAAFNILVFEFVETWNKKERANIDGFYLNPNVIVLKRHQNSFRREIFTLAHELGHYLLNEEEIEQLELSNFSNNNLTSVERWCNDFAYHFLVGELDVEIEKINSANSINDYYYEKINFISNQTHISKIALYTRLLYLNKISQKDYNLIKADFEEKFQKMQENKLKQKESDKLMGIKRGGSVPKPINSPLLISTLQTAYYEGVLSEFEFCKSLNIQSDKLSGYLI